MLSAEKDNNPKNLEISKSKQIRDLKVANARLKHQLMIQQAIAAIQCSKEPNWGIK